MKALILAAGYATRLYPLSKDTPKPLLHVANRPIADYIIDKVEPVGQIDKVVLITNQKFYNDFKQWSDRLLCSKAIEIINDGTTSEENRLGAIGDMNFAIQKCGINDDLLVVAGDNLFDFSLADFIEFSRSKSDCAVVGAYDMKNKRLVQKYGTLILDNEKRLIRFEEKPKKPKTTLISVGIYYFPRSKLQRISEYLSKNQEQDAPGYYIDWLSKQEKVYGYVFNRSWFDIGDLGSYVKANNEYKRRKA